MFLNFGTYIVNTDQVLYLEPKEKEVIVHFAGGTSVALDRQWIKPPAAKQLGLSR